jgi:hypothetical protein
MFEFFKFGKKEEEKVPQEKIQGEESIEVSKLEWGPDLGEVNWEEALKKLEQLNASLAEGEFKWRFPSEYDLLDRFKTPGFGGLNPDTYYWFIDQDESGPGGDKSWAGINSRGLKNFIPSGNSLCFVRGRKYIDELRDNLSK